MNHIPVLLDEVLKMLNPMDGDKIIDATFGYGGHTEAILKASKCFVTAIDRDPTVKSRANDLKRVYGERFSFVPGKFADIIATLNGQYDKVLFDFGVSSMQLDVAERGFSFSKDGTLDMRMSCEGISAYEVINTYSETDLAEIIYNYGNEVHSRKIAKAIIESRNNNKIETTLQLHEIITSVFGYSKKHRKHSDIDVATKTFQAIRIYVNDELREIDTALHNLTKILNGNAIIATITFHALEDRIVKYWASSNAHFKPIVDGVITASAEEIKRNPRSRSAKLRGFIFNNTKL